VVKLITLLGQNSQLARCLVNALKLPVDIVSSQDVDLRGHEEVKVLLGSFKNKVLINCFAYNDVEGAESNQDAYNINHLGVQEVAKFCDENDILLIHFSTDFIFDGRKGQYIESDPVNPINHYGESKAAGEIAIQRFCKKYLIIRTSWLYSHLETQNNFLYKIKSLAIKDKQVLYGANDIFGSPTSALSLADGISKLLGSIDHYDFSKKIFHFSDVGSVSRFSFLEAIIQRFNEKLNLSNVVMPVENDYFRLIAPRPYNTSLNPTLFADTFEFQQVDWKQALDRTIGLI
jgi:dTDP-4-dehydrorhamnose reductase